jgi:hypothetical protein
VLDRNVATVEKHLRGARDALGVETTVQSVCKASILNQIFRLNAENAPAASGWNPAFPVRGKDSRKFHPTPDGANVERALLGLFQSPRPIRATGKQICGRVDFSPVA